MWKRRHVWSWLLKRRECLTLLEDLACWRRTRSWLGCDARGYLATHPPILGPSRPAGATFNMADWPLSTTIEMTLLAFNLEAWKTIIFETGLDELSLRRSARTPPKIGRRQSREEAQLAKTGYNSITTACLTRTCWVTFTNGGLTGYPGRYSFLILRCFVWRVLFLVEFWGKYLHQGQKL